MSVESPLPPSGVKLTLSEHSCLWNHKSEGYKNRQLRWKTLEHLRMILSAHPPPAPFTVEDIKNKFKNLRTTFQRQYKMVRASKECGSNDVFVPQWKHYQQLVFLQACNDLDDSVDIQPQSPLTVQQKESQPALTSPGLVVSFLQPLTSISSSSCTPPNMLVKCFWTEEKERALIDFYYDHSCLWNKKSENHNNRQLRLRLLETLRSQLSDHSVSFSENSCLWNHKSESYRNKLLRQSLLETLSSLLSDSETVPFTVEEIKTKFRNLRTIFQREHKAVSSNKTCGSEDFYFPKWKHYRELMFLCDSCDEDDQSEDLHFHRPQQSDPLDGQDSPSSLHYRASFATTCQISNEKKSTSQSLEALPSPTPPDSQLSSSSTSSSHADSRLSRRKRARHRLTSTTSEVLDFMRSFCQSHVVSQHAGFLKYVEECLNETPPHKVKKLKKKIIETIHSVSEEV
ncbi:uncharacterized protein ACBR49_014474 isoform 3-T3 [Aulostomus maculatus]